ncbi:MAG: hypothetical protein QOF52_296, partial [Propionibacteriaceae bacterium]|nr:hypothetical protein [Propionibacteriaceae bacterium]
DTDVLAAEFGPFLFWPSADPYTLYADYATVGIVESCQTGQQGGLSRAGRPDDNHDLTGCNGQADTT